MKKVKFEIDGYKILASGSYNEDNDTIYDIDYDILNENEIEPVDDDMNAIILDYCSRLLWDKFNYQELEF